MSSLRSKRICSWSSEGRPSLGAKKEALKGYILIMTLLLEVLASDFAGWGRRFPMAKRMATAVLSKYLPTTRTRLLDYYLPPRGHQRSELVKLLTALSPPE